MPRKRRSGTLRNSRTYSELSGVTISTIDSGVSLTTAGILANSKTVNTTVLGLMDGYGGKPILGTASSASTAFMVSGDSAAWSGSSISVNFTDLGITKLYGFSAQFVCDITGGVSVGAHKVKIATFPTGVSISVQAIDPIAQAGVSTIANSGGSIYWMAFHT